MSHAGSFPYPLPLVRKPPHFFLLLLLHLHLSFLSFFLLNSLSFAVSRSRSLHDLSKHGNFYTLSDRLLESRSYW